MADGKVALARLRLKTIAEGLTADGLALEAARVFVGTWSAVKAFAGTFSLVGAPELKIGSASLGFSGFEDPLVVEAELTVALDGSTDQSWTNVDNRSQALRAAWLDGGNYPLGELTAGRVDYEPYRVELRGDVTVVRVGLLVGFGSPD